MGGAPKNGNGIEAVAALIFLVKKLVRSSYDRIFTVFIFHCAARKASRE